jgi:hypothetical protein
MQPLRVSFRAFPDELSHRVLVDLWPGGGLAVGHALLVGTSAPQGVPKPEPKPRVCRSLCERIGRALLEPPYKLGYPRPPTAGGSEEGHPTMKDHEVAFRLPLSHLMMTTSHVPLLRSAVWDDFDVPLEAPQPLPGLEQKPYKIDTPRFMISPGGRRQGTTRESKA